MPTTATERRALPTPVCYALAIAATLLITLLRSFLHPFLGRDAALLAYPIAVMISAWCGGLGPGLLATALSTLGGAVFLRSSDERLPGDNLKDGLCLVLFLIVGICLAMIGEAMHRARARIEDKRRLLKDEILVRKRAEIRLFESENRTRRQYQELEQIYHNAPVGLCVIDRAFRYLRINDALAAMNGRPAAEHIGRTVREMLPQSADCLEPLYRQVLSTGQPVLNVTLRGERPGHPGRVEACIANYFPVGDPSGYIHAVGCVVQDISERIRAEEERERLLQDTMAARTQAEAANRTKDEFLATLSHELRTPLNAIMGWVNILRHGVPDANDLDEGLRVIDQNCRAQLKLIEDLLDVSSIMAGKLHLDRASVCLAEVLDHAITAIEPVAQVKQIGIVREFDPEARPVHGDRSRLEQVFWNLLSNAVKFTPRGGRITVELRASRESVLACVTDTGVGIDPDFLPHVFERFRQADGSTTRRQGGLGLGLAIVKQLVEMHEGRVVARSLGKDQGTTFEVELPAMGAGTLLEPRVSPSGAGDSWDSSGTERRVSLEGLRVLVVDDQPDARALLDHGLTLYGAQTRMASSVSEALEVVATFQPHVVVCDIGMPEQDGYDFIREHRSGPAAALPVIALTAFAGIDDRERVLQAGFSEYLPKPVDLPHLFRLIARLGSDAPAGRTEQSEPRGGRGSDVAASTPHAGADGVAGARDGTGPERSGTVPGSFTAPV